MSRVGHTVTEPFTQDPLSAMTPLLRVRPELQDVCRFAFQWDTVHEAEPPGWAQFHIVTKGRCLLERYGAEPLRLEAGNLLLLPHGDAHVVRSACRGGSSGMPVRIERAPSAATCLPLAARHGRRGVACRAGRRISVRRRG